MPDAAAAAVSTAMSEEEKQEQVDVAMRALDSQPRDLVEAHAGNEMAMRPATLRYHKLTRDQYVLRQWILRDQLRMQIDTFSHEQLTAHEVTPPWRVYEFRHSDAWHPARVILALKDGRTLRVFALVPGGVKRFDAKRQELRPISAWSPEQCVKIMRCETPGLFTDPLGSVAVQMAAGDETQPQ